MGETFIVVYTFKQQFRVQLYGTIKVIELVKAGADLLRVRDYLRQYAGDLVPMFEELVNEALAG